MFGRMKDPVEGTAQLVSYQLTNIANEFDVVVQMQLVVQAEGLEPTAVEAAHGIPHGELPMTPGRTFKVKVDRKNPKKLKFLEDDSDGEAQAAKGRAEAERLAQAMRETGEPGEL